MIRASVRESNPGQDTGGSPADVADSEFMAKEDWDADTDISGVVLGLLVEGIGVGIVEADTAVDDTDCTPWFDDSLDEGVDGSEPARWLDGLERACRSAAGGDDEAEAPTSPLPDGEHPDSSRTTTITAPAADIARPEEPHRRDNIESLGIRPVSLTSATRILV